MIKKSKLYLSSALSTIAILGSFQPVEAANILWDSSTSSNMFDATNWTPASIPTTGDTAQFGAGTSVAPFLNAGNDITTDTITLTSATARQFAIQGTGTTLTLGTATVGTGVNNSGGGATLQAFNISDGALMHFVDSGSARVSGPVTYNVTNPSSLGNSQLLFSNSTKAGNGFIGLTPQPAILNVSNPLSMLTFQNNADANTSVITASNGGNVFFNSTFSNTNAKITLNSGSHLFVAQNTAIDTLQSSDPLTTVQLQNGATLTVGSQDGSIKNFAGSIAEVAGSSAFVKRGNDILVIPNGSNSYSGGTTVQNGTLLVTPSSLPVAATSPSVTIFPLQPMETIPPTLSFGLVGVSTVYSGDILNNGIIGVSAPTGDLQILELSGDISGAGIILVSDTGDLTLSGTNTYSGGTFNSGVINTTAANLPAFGDVVMFQQTPTSPIPLLNFTTTGTETFFGSIVNLGPNIPGGFVALSGSGHLTLAGFNNYDQGTYIIDGWLTGDTDSIPVAAAGPSVTVAFDGIMEFNQTVPGTFAGEISLLNSAAILRSSGFANLEISEAITGIGRLEVDAGQLTLSGLNTYSGGSTVASGATLIGNSNSLQNAIANEGSVVFEQNFNGIFNGSFSGAGTIEKDGAGILSLETPSPTFSGTTNVNAGVFNLNTLLGGDVNVNASRISGNGTVGRNLTLQNGSVIAPGNSIGTLVVNGDFSMTSADVYEVEVDGDGNSDLIDVKNNATLAGTVSAVSIDGGYSDEEYLIMNIEGTRTGAFENLVTLSSRVIGQLRYADNADSSQVFLRLQSIFNLYAETYNQRQVSNQLATITNPSPELDLILNELEILGSSPDTIDQVRLAYDQMSGVQYAHVALVSEISGNQFLRRLYDPIRSVVTRHQCFENLCCEQAVDVWFEAGGGRMNIDGSRNVRGFDVDSYQLSGGVQTEIQSDVIVGLAGSYANDKLDYRKLNGHGTSHTGFAGLYGLYRPNCGYVFVDAIYGYTDTKMKRQINIGPLEYLARSKPKISQARGYIEAGYDLDSCFCSDTLIQPFVGLEVRSFRRNHVSEKGAYPLNLCIASKRKSDVLSRLGVHVTANELFCNSFLSLDLAWQYRFTNSNNTLRERFQSFGNEFKIKGRDIGRNSVDAALTFSTSLGNNWELYVEAIGEAWSNTCAYNFLGGVQYNW